MDEALAGHAERVDVILHADQSLEVIDDGASMLVDIHPEEGVPAVKLILCRLHAGDTILQQKLPVLRRLARRGDFRG